MYALCHANADYLPQPPLPYTPTPERDSSHDWTGRGGINFLSLRAGRPTAAEHSKESKRGRPPIVACRPRVEGTSRVRPGDGFWNASYSARVAVDILSSRTLQGTSFGGERPLCRTTPRRLCKVHGSIPMSGVQHCAHDETTYRMSIYQSRRMRLCQATHCWMNPHINSQSSHAPDRVSIYQDEVGRA